ncbi:hypothetical protein [Lacticaseibacillus salsurivasis]|uniref:hypothetical protein n=1 Tax=Lacticaseibacillus salsurivasis TaxID=3081441 RepID=UPI0030C6915E
MKTSLVKMIGLYSFLYALFTLGVLAYASLLSFRSGFSFPAVGEQMMQWEPHWWWLSIIGVVLHGFAYLKAMRRPQLMIAHLICVWAFVAYPLIPNYSLFIAIVQLVAVWLLISYHRPMQESEMEGQR